MKRITNPLFIILGLLSLLMGIIGIFLPLLPTTPFALLAAYFFSKGSRKLHIWLLSTKYLGRIIRDWESNGIIRPKAKIYSSILIIPLFMYTLIYVKVHLIIKIIVSLIGISVLIFIWTRPSMPSGKGFPRAKKQIKI